VAVCLAATVSEVSLVQAAGPDGVTSVATIEDLGGATGAERLGRGHRLLKAAYAPGVVIRRVNNRLMITQVTYLGRSPFLCTPSGFGQKSTCRPR
jgi:hypothetical protein